MDPLSITTGVVSLTAKCMQTAKTLYAIRNDYKTAHITLRAICSEITVISVTLSRLQMIMLGDSDIFTRSDDMRYDVKQAFETVLTGCMVVISALDEEVESLANGAVIPERMTITGRVKFLWKEGEMQDLLNQIRNQQSALNMLIGLLQMESASEIQRKIEHNTAMLAEISQGTKHIRSTRPSLRAAASIYEVEFDTKCQRVNAFDGVSSIGTSDFAFDNILVNSKAYRRVLQAAQAAQRHDQADISEDAIVFPPPSNDGESESSVRTATRDPAPQTLSVEDLEVASTLDQLSDQWTSGLKEVSALDKEFSELLAQCRATDWRSPMQSQMEESMQSLSSIMADKLKEVSEVAARSRVFATRCLELEQHVPFKDGTRPKFDIQPFNHLSLVAETVLWMLENRVDLHDFHLLETKYRKVKYCYFEQQDQVTELQQEISKLRYLQELSACVAGGKDFFQNTTNGLTR